jgi:hypothetical protein
LRKALTFHSDYISNIDATVTSCVNVIKVKTNCNYIDILPDNKRFLLINYQFDHSMSHQAHYGYVPLNQTGLVLGYILVISIMKAE